MTVTYTAKVSTSSLGCFLKLLLRWRGSIYKLLWREFVIFVMAYYCLNLSYRFAMNEDQRRIFERLAIYCDSYGNLIPVSFVLGFYVSIVIDRWWGQFRHIPWPDRMSLFITAIIHGHDERGRLMRRTISRYMSLSYVITMSSISMPVKKRFPTFSHMTEAGFMLPAEQEIIENIKTPHNKYFVPLVWSASLISRARKEGRIKDDHAVKTLIDELNSYRGMLGELFNYDCISVPLVYTQVVTLAVYMFFFGCLMGRQFLQRPHVEDADMIIPVFTFLQFFFYMGWLKVAETLVNPFGEDDDDFDINRFIDRNLQIAYLVVDEMHEDHPDLIKDQYWDDVEFELPYTAAAAEYRVSEPHLGSAMDIDLGDKDAEFMPLSSIQEENNLEDIHNEHLMEMGTTPTQIPHHRQHSNVDNTSMKTTASHAGSRIRSLIHSLHRDSRRNLHKDSPATTSRKLCSRGSQTSGMEYVGQGSPTMTSLHPDDIFSMSDLSDVDLDENRSKLLDTIASSDFLHMLRNRAASDGSVKPLHEDGKQTSGKSGKDGKSKEKEKMQRSEKHKFVDDYEEDIEMETTGKGQSCDKSMMANLEPIVEGTPEFSDATGESASSRHSTLVKSDDSGSDGLPVRPELNKSGAGDIHLAVAALEDLKFRQEKDRPEYLLRSKSVAGSDMTAELGLTEPDEEDESRPISTSQGLLRRHERPMSMNSETSAPDQTQSGSSAPSTNSLLSSDPSLLDKEIVIGDFAEISEDGMTWKKTPVTGRAKKKTKTKAKDSEKRESSDFDLPPLKTIMGYRSPHATTLDQDIPRVIHSSTARSRIGPNSANFEFASDEVPLVGEVIGSFGRPRQGKSSLSKSLASPIKYPKPDV